MHTSRSIVLLVLAAVALAGCKHTPATQTPSAGPVISTEERPTMLLIISKSSGRKITPGIDIFADGRCLVRTFQGEELERRLQPSTVRGLLVFFERQGLFSISDESIERAIDRELQPVITELPNGGVSGSFPSRVDVVDASHTRIAARTLSKTVEISRYALDVELKQYRTVTELRTVQKCLERVYEVAGNIGW